MVLCLFHHEAYNVSIHHTVFPRPFLVFSPSNITLYQTHKTFAFHPAVAHFHSLEVTSPWKGASPIYPSPHEDLLKAHLSIFSSVAAAETLDGNDHNDDDSELVEITPIHNEAVRIWAEDSETLF
jgi:hypothetical protein